METSHTPPKTLHYIGIFVALAVLTGIEIAASTAIAGSALRVVLLLGLAVSKATLVALYYMHLRYDSRMFAVIFLIPVVFFIGFVLALAFS
jgi:cytochrome c oxidase subunit 4